MKIHEYQAKELLARYGVAIPKGKLARTALEAEAAAKELGGPVLVVKAQIHAGGRGKGGGIKLAKGGPAEVREHAEKILGMTLVTPQTGPEGKVVERVYVEQGSDIARELYLGMVVDRETQRVVVMASTEGGMNIEDVARDTPERIAKVWIEPSVGLQPFQCRQVAFALGLDGKAIGAEFDIPQVQIVNDFAAAASGIEMLQEADRVVLQPGDPMPAAPRLVIGAGTGLGVAYLLSTATGYRVIAGESGHAGFAPATPEQAGLWHHLYQRLGRVSVEDVVSGPGLVRIREYVEHTEERPEPEASHAAARVDATRAGVTPAAIVRGALESGDPQNLRALDLFIACYGEVAGNCALALLARGGVYVAGGIAPKILPRLRTGGFLAAFNAKGPHSEAMRKIPVSIVTNERLGLLGCALIAARSQHG